MPSTPVARSQPRKMSLADCIRRWPSTTRRPWFAYAALAGVRLEHGRLGLLDLQEQRVVAVAPAAAAAIHDRVPTLPTPTTLRAKSTQLERLEQLPAVRLQRPAVAPEPLVQNVAHLVRRHLRHQLVERNDERRIAEDADPPVDHPGQLRERAADCRGCGPSPCSSARASSPTRAPGPATSRTRRPRRAGGTRGRGCAFRVLPHGFAVGAHRPADDAALGSCRRTPGTGRRCRSSRPAASRPTPRVRDASRRSR